MIYVSREQPFPPLSFEEAYEILKKNGPAHFTTDWGSEYHAEAYVMERGDRNGIKVIRARSEHGPSHIRYLYIHADCWGHDRTCSGSPAAAIYRGRSNMFTWLVDRRNDSPVLSAPGALFAKEES